MFSMICGKGHKKIRNYQQEAIDNWMNNNYNGLFEMATGSGKTYTSISAAKQLYEKNKKLCLVVLAPLKHLVTQWAEELESFDFKPILCFDDSNKWQREAYAELQKYKSGIKDKICFVATHKTATLDPFKNFIKTGQTYLITYKLENRNEKCQAIIESIYNLT